MKNLIIITCMLCLSTLSLQAQEATPKKQHEQDKIKIRLKEASHPDIYIDGKKYDHEILELLDQSKIESINVLKDEEAQKEYDAPNGVILITTKKAAQNSTQIQEIRIRDKNTKIEISGDPDSDNSIDPVVIIDGEIAEKDALSKMAPEDIESIKVWKGDKAIEKYDAPNGAIVITTKKK